LEISHRKFLVPDDFNANKFYENYFGIISPKDEKPDEIILSFDSFQGKYIKSLPLHTLQEILIDNEAELRVKLRICITHDFVMELLSHGDSVRVISPEKLIKELKEIYNNVLNFY
jgi:predicted DNA-binding transcriptional regulator YafY